MNEMPILEEVASVVPDGEVVVRSFDEFYRNAHQKLVAACREDDDSWNEHLSQQNFDFLARELQGRPHETILYSMTQFLNCPLLVTDDHLKEFVAMEPAGEGYKLAKGHEVIYMRSFSMTVDVFQNILREMQKGMEMQKCMEFNATMRAWHSWIQILQPGDSVTVRYVGRVRGRKTPWNRHREDLLTALSDRKKAISSGIGATLRLFIRAANVVSKQVLTDVKIWAFQKSLVEASEIHSSKNATLDRLEMSLTDAYERFAIAWFDSETLINAQLGGKYRIWNCDPADEQLFNI